jgi:NAD(P)-dependent dehydrogenase (short-subunit alcohol dehydrogenase family)
MKFSPKKQTILITGANQGLGFEIAKYFAQKDKILILCGRTEKLNNIAKKKLTKFSKKNIFFYKLDISKKNDVDKFYSKIFKKFKKIDVLINNAGIYGPKGHTHLIDWNELIKTININLVGSIYMIRKILSHFKNKKSGKIIQMSGGGASSSFPFFSSYSISKVGIVRFVENVAEEYKKYKIFANSVAPGPVNTRMLDEVLKAGPKIVGKNFYEKSLKQLKKGGTDIRKIVSLIDFLSSDESNGITGKLISALWDNWIDFKKHNKILKKSDVGTLRRITGRDRKLNFFDI